MNIDRYKIIATFKYGSVWNNRLLGFMITLFALISIGFACFSFIMWQENSAVSILGFLVDVLFIGLFIFEFIKAIRNRRYVKKSLEDAIEKKVIVRLFDKDNGIGLNYKGVKISVSFHHNKKKIKQHSVFDRVFTHYIDQEILILYSPRNEGVLVCKMMEKNNEK